MIKLAEEIARKAHEGQYDKAGRPFIEHPKFVSENCNTYEARIVGWLHDVVEDTDVTIEDLESQGFSDAVIEAVRCITKPSDNYCENKYYFGIHNNPIAKEVKLADLTHNMDLSRIPEGTSSDYIELMVKKRDNYMRYYNYLTKAPMGISLKEFEKQE